MTTTPPAPQAQGPVQTLPAGAPESSPGPGVSPDRGHRSLTGLLAKIVLLGIVDALAIYGLFALAANGSWKAFAAMLIGAVVINYVYLRPGLLPAKYLVPGLVFLLVYQVYVVLYTGYAAFTNYGDGHNASKSDAVAAILANSETRVPDSAQYKLSVLSKDGALAFLVTDPEGNAQVGTADSPLEPAADAQKDSTGKASSLPGYTTLKFNQIVQRQDAVTNLRVPISEDPAAGSVRTSDGSTAFVFRSTLTYDAKSGDMRDTQNGTVYQDNGEGTFVSTHGQALQPGWKVNVGFSNFTRVLTNQDIRGPFLGVLIWTFAFAIITVVLTFAVGLGLALVLNDPRIKGQRTYRSLLILPYAFPAFLSALVWAGLFNTDFGFINQVLLGGANIGWLTSEWPARAAVLLVNLWLGYPYMFLVCTGALQSLPAELTEAAKVDGAGAWRIFRSVKLPLLLVSLAPLLIASFAFNFNNFNTIYLLTGGGPKNLDASVDVGYTDILITFVYKLAFGGTNRQYGFACAISILIFLIVASISAVTFRRTRALEELS